MAQCMLVKFLQFSDGLQLIHHLYIILYDGTVPVIMGAFMLMSLSTSCYVLCKDCNVAMNQANIYKVHTVAFNHGAGKFHFNYKQDRINNFTLWQLIVDSGSVLNVSCAVDE